MDLECPECGEDIADWRKRCPNCGASMEDAEPSQEHRPPEKGNTPWGWLITIAVLGAVCIAIFATTMPSSASSPPRVQSVADNSQATEPDKRPDSKDVRMWFNGNGCKGDKKHPLGITVQNNSTGIVKNISFWMHVYQPGFSDDLAQSSLMEWNGIVPAGAVKTLCYEWPQLSRHVNASLTIDPKIMTVDFYASGEFVPADQSQQR